MKFIVNETTGRVMAKLPDTWNGDIPKGCRLVDRVEHKKQAVSDEEKRKHLERRERELQIRERDAERQIRKRILAVERREAACRRAEKGIDRGPKKR